MTEISETILHQALSLLGTLLEEGQTRYSLVVVGGSALLAQKIISRKTHDVDVIALDEGDTRAHPLPQALKDAAARVAVEMKLESNWLNSSVSLFIGREQLPEHMWWGFDSRSYGPCLRVCYMRRDALILLKLHAALDRDQPRDLSDLISLAPSAEETARHLDWILREILGQTSHPKMERILNHLGHDHLLSRYQKAP